MDLLQLQGVMMPSTEPPPLTVTLAPGCADNALAFSLTSDCYEVPPSGTNGVCIYCFPSTADERQNCVIFPNAAQASQDVVGCNPLKNSGFNALKQQAGQSYISVAPGLLITPLSSQSHDGNRDAGGFRTHDATSEYGMRHKYYVVRALQLGVGPCHAPHCPNPEIAQWLCRMYVYNSASASWRMLCNHPKEMPQGQPPGSQLHDRLLDFIHSTDRDHVFVYFSLGSRGGCFNTLNNYCLVSSCPGPNANNPTPNCWGDLDSAAKTTIETYDQGLVIKSAMAFSTDNIAYPRHNPADITLKNSCLATFRWFFTKFTQGRNSRLNFASKNINAWFHSGDFHGADPASGNTVADPPVREGGHSSTPIVPITLTSWLTGLQFPAQLTLKFHSTVARFTGQGFSGFGAVAGGRWFRVAANIETYLEMRIQLLPDHADWPQHPEWDDDPDLRPFRFLNPDDPFNHKIDDPNDLLVPHGPNNCRVPLYLTWRGVRGPSPYARGPYVFENAGNARHECLTFYQGIGTKLTPRAIFGEINNQNETVDTGVLPQRHVGGVMISRD